MAFYHKRDKLYRKLRHQINSSSQEKVLQYINYLIFEYTENVYFSKKIEAELKNNKMIEKVSQEANGLALVIGLVFILLISILIDFLREINDKVIKDKNGKKRWSSKSVSTIGILVIIIAIVMLALGISKMSFPQQINIGRHQYQLIDEKSVEE